ncbi:MAG TPA: hypothetical protein VFE65_35760 [Pseudonocardia sp.]|nr:hypothetical protein [Pseudonocardia sp.]
MTTVLADGSVIGSPASLGLMALAGVLVAAVVVVVNVWLRWQRSRSRPAKIEPNTVEASPIYRRYLVAAAWAGGSPRNWDHSVRPVLAELVELAVAARSPQHGDVNEIVREKLGDDLWALVDRGAPRSEDRQGSGAGRAALLEILNRVEKT